jgi:hypothetical protein
MLPASSGKDMTDSIWSDKVLFRQLSPRYDVRKIISAYFKNLLLRKFGEDVSAALRTDAALRSLGHIVDVAPFAYVAWIKAVFFVARVESLWHRPVTIDRMKRHTMNQFVMATRHDHNAITALEFSERPKQALIPSMGMNSFYKPRIASFVSGRIASGHWRSLIATLFRQPTVYAVGCFPILSSPLESQ